MDKVQVNGIDWQLEMMQSLVQDSFLGSPIKLGNPVLQHLLHNRLQVQEAVYTLPPMYAMLCNGLAAIMTCMQRHCNNCVYMTQLTMYDLQV